MKKIILSLLAVVACINYADAQIIEIFRNGKLANRLTITADNKYKIVVKECTDTKECVDLGLPSGTLWATCNIGANKPEEDGYYFAWGENMGDAGYDEDGRIFNWASYKWCNGSNTAITKYCLLSEYGIIDNKSTLDVEDDAAFANWGVDWCMPNKDQIQELFNEDYTTTEWTTLNDVKGRKITSKSNGNSIFLPAAGQRTLKYYGDYGYLGYYWSCEIYKTSCAHAFAMEFNSSHYSGSYIERYKGFSIRPVRLSQASDSHLLPDQFSVSATKKVQFAKSNLYWDGSAYKFEVNQTDYPTTWDANHVSHFFWNTPEDVSAGNYPYAQTFSYGTQTTSDKFFCDEDNKITVEGTEGLYALSSDEWSYLLNTRPNASNLIKTGVMVGSKINCLIIAPDNFDGTLKLTYTLDEIKTLGLVCLPAAGCRTTSIISGENEYGYYCSSTPYDNDSMYSFFKSFNSYSFNIKYIERFHGLSVRLVKTIE